MRLITTILAIMSLALPANAAQGFRSIVLECSTPPGRCVRVQLDATLNIRYEYGLMEITGTHVYVQVPLANIARWYFSREATEGVVGDPDAVVDTPDVDMGCGFIEITGCSQPTDVVLYDMAGRVYFIDTVTDSCTINLDGLAPGVYILRTGAESYKIRVGG